MIKEHRDAIAKAFKDDPDFRRTYVDNIAMLLFDQAQDMNFKVPGDRNKIANKIVKLIFES